MTRSDLVEELAARFSQLTHRDAEFAVKAILDGLPQFITIGCDDEATTHGRQITQIGLVYKFVVPFTEIH